MPVEARVLRLLWRVVVQCCKGSLNGITPPAHAFLWRWYGVLKTLFDEPVQHPFKELSHPLGELSGKYRHSKTFV